MEGYPIPGLDGGYPILLMGGGTLPKSGQGGYPGVHLDGGTPPPIQDLMGSHHPRLDGVPPSKTGWGRDTPLSRTGWGMDGPQPSAPPPLVRRTDQQSEHLQRGGQCAFCVHAGGLSCYLAIFIYFAALDQNSSKETDVWQAQYFSRAMDNEMWMFSASYNTA